MAAVQRDRAWIDREYGRDKWPAVLERIDSLVAAGETSLARVAALVNQWEHGGGGADSTATTVLGQATPLPTALAYPGFYALVRQLLLTRCAEIQPDLVVEIGAGWGRNMVDLWTGGGPRDARYAALEYTEAGRICVQRLAALEPAMRLETGPFDYFAPSLDGFVPGKRTLVCTIFSADQIPTVPEAAFETLLAAGDDVWGLHLEPFGWQWRDENGGSTVGSSAAYAARHDYNRNFWPMMGSLQARGLIKVETVVPELYGANPENAASLLMWRKR
jgi:hypothetical protein